MTCKKGLRTVFGVALLFFSASSKSSELSPLDNSFTVWLRLLNYKSIGPDRWLSRNTYSAAFFSPNGPTDPRSEYEASKKALIESGDAIDPNSKMARLCTFTARRLYFERFENLKFQQTPCPDYENWRTAISADEVKVVYAGPYINNPASLMGHTFFRFARKDEPENPGKPLLSYSAGFVARTSADDNALSYAYKGITGGYPGMFQINPHYENVGLYNNAEARDLWEYDLNLKPQEIEFLLAQLWEIQFTELVPYYFLDENCSYRPLAILETLRPQSQLLEKTKSVVLPLDTIKLISEQGFIPDPTPQFRGSAKRRLDNLIADLTPSQSKTLAQEDLSTQDSKVLDALIQKWSLEFYKNRGVLSESKSARLEQAISARAKIQIPSSLPSDQELQKSTLGSPLAGHPSSWVIAGTSLVPERNSSNSVYFKYRMGAHALDSHPAGYDHPTSIEYLGIDLGPYQRLLLASIYSFKTFTPRSPELSWNAISEITDIYGNGLSHDTKVGAGFYFGNLYLLAQARYNDKESPHLAPEFEFGFMNFRLSSSDAKSIQLRLKSSAHLQTLNVTHHWTNRHGIEIFAMKPSQRPLFIGSGLIFYY